MTAPFDSYLRRLGVDRQPPSTDALFQLHRAQIERVPYETTWIHLGEPWGIDPLASVERIALGGRGGYCFHLNGALAGLLTDLGYDVTLHVGGVYRNAPDENALTNHLVLTVANLAADDNPSGVWYVDTGLGDALYEPLPLRAGTYEQGPMRFELAETPGGVGDWQLTHDPKGSFDGMSFSSRPATIAEFAARHQHLSTSPESTFVQTVCVQQRNRAQLNILRALTLTTIDSKSKRSVVVDDHTDWFAMLADDFRLDLGSTTPASRDLLWRSAHSAHERHTQ